MVDALDHIEGGEFDDAGVDVDGVLSLRVRAVEASRQGGRVRVALFGDDMQLLARLDLSIDVALGLAAKGTAEARHILFLKRGRG